MTSSTRSKSRVVSIRRTLAAGGGGDTPLFEALSARRDTNQRNLRAAEKLFALGLTLYEDSRFLEAISAFESVTRLIPNDPRGHYGLCIALRRDEQLQLSDAALDRASELVSENPEAHHDIWVSIEILRGNRELVAERKRAIEIDPNNAEAYYKLGVVLDLDLRPQEAIAAINRSLEIDPNITYPFFKLGTLYFNIGQPQKAIAMLKRAIEFYPNYADLHYFFGQVLAISGYLPEAIKVFNRLAALDSKISAGEILDILDKAPNRPKNAILLHDIYAIYDGMQDKSESISEEGGREAARKARAWYRHRPPGYENPSSRRTYQTLGKIDFAAARPDDDDLVRKANTFISAFKLLEKNEPGFSPDKVERDRFKAAEKLVNAAKYRRRKQRQATQESRLT
jgi:tetratricopeptide (TPR) repeat protein